MSRPDPVARARERLADRNGAARVEPYPAGQLGDAYEPPDDGPPPAAGSANVPTVRFDLVDSATFAAADYRREWLIRRILVRGQPAVLGGPKKSLKTSLLVDLALSLGTASPFLGEFAVPSPARVALLSGESGEPTLQETARRVATAKGIDLAAASVFWGFRLPQLASPEHLDALREAIERHAVEVLLLDPLYLSLLAGAGRDGIQASNLYQTGPLLLAVAQTCLQVGCTPVLAHHFKLTREKPYGEPQLEDLAYSGIQEFARQWVLLGRREKYQPGTGSHALWLSVGGSSGHGGLWAVDVDEGQMGEDFVGRHWRVEVQDAATARQAAKEEGQDDRRRKQRQQDQDDDAKLLATLDQLDPGRRGCGETFLRKAANVPEARAQRSLIRLKVDGIIEAITVESVIGNGAKRAVQGVRRPPHEDD